MADLQALVQQIKNSINLVDVIGEYTKLSAKGSNHTACCPFHKEDTPSFFVNEDRQLYHCFGCGVGGDVFTFLQNIEKLTFIESAKVLAKRAHIPWENLERTDNELRDKLFEINKLTAQFYNYILTDLPAGKDAKEYIYKKRNLTKDTVQKFLVGAAPEQGDLLSKYLKKKGFTLKEMVEAGVVTQYETRSYDRFKGRIVFPIWDHLGQIVGFTGRILNDNKKIAKYLNSPQTLIFNKSNLVYGLFHAKEYVRQEKKIILVEGQMDVLMAAQNGYNNVVAASGTSLSVDHLKLMKRYADSIILCFDRDAAGFKALERAIVLAWQADIKVKVLEIPEDCGKDPDDCIQNNKEKWDEIIKSPLTVWQYYKNKWTGFKNLEEKKEVNKEFFALLEKVPDSIEKEFWFQNFAQHFSLDLNIIKEDFEKHLSAQTKYPDNNKKTEVALPVETKSYDNEDHFIALLLHFMFNVKLESVISFLSLEAIVSDEKRELYKAIIIYYTNNNFEEKPNDFNENLNKFLDEIDSEYKDIAHYLYLLFTVNYEDLTLIEKKKHFSNIIKKIKKDFTKKEIHQANIELEKNDTAELANKLKDLIRELNIINKYNF